MRNRLPAAAISVLLIGCDAHTAINGAVKDRSGIRSMLLAETGAPDLADEVAVVRLVPRTISDIA
jgi:hypothetical protein